MDVRDKVVIVTGASRGIGRQIAIELGRRGARVVLSARTIDPRRTLPGTLGETLRIIEAAGGAATVVEGDVAEPAYLEHLVATAVETFSGLDIVVNNAADMVGGDIEKLLEAMIGRHSDLAEDGPPPSSFERWLAQFAVNVHAPYLLMTLALPHLRASGGGVIVNITSEAADLVPLDDAVSNPPMNPSLGYAVTKAALNRLTNALAPTIAADGIAVVAVDPGVVHTEVREVLEEGGVRFSGPGAPMSVPVAAVLDVVTSDDPMGYSGQIIRAQPSSPSGPP